MRERTRGDYAVGWGRPPKHTRWKKGQTGNPSRVRRAKSLDVANLIEKAFQRKIVVTEGTDRKRTTVFEAIVLQLWTKAANKDTRAMAVFLDYQDFVASNCETGGVQVILRP